MLRGLFVFIKFNVQTLRGLSIYTTLDVQADTFSL